MFKKALLLCFLPILSLSAADLFSSGKDVNPLEENQETPLSLSGNEAFKIRFPHFYKDRLVRVEFDIAFEEGSAGLVISGVDTTEIDDFYRENSDYLWVKMPNTGTLENEILKPALFFEDSSLERLKNAPVIWGKLRRADNKFVHGQEEEPPVQELRSLFFMHDDSRKTPLVISPKKGNVQHVSFEFSPISGEYVRLLLSSLGDQPQLQAKISNMRIQATGFAEYFDGSTFSGNPRKALRWGRYRSTQKQVPSPVRRQSGAFVNVSEDKKFPGFSLPFSFQDVGDDAFLTYEVAVDSTAIAADVWAEITLRGGNNIIVDAPKNNQRLIYRSEKGVKSAHLDAAALREIMNLRKSFDIFQATPAPEGEFTIPYIFIRYEGMHVQTPADALPMIDDGEITFDVAEFCETAYAQLETMKTYIHDETEEFGLLSDAQRKSLLQDLDCVRASKTLLAGWKVLWDCYMKIYEDTHGPQFSVAMKDFWVKVFTDFNAKESKAERALVFTKALKKLNAF